MSDPSGMSRLPRYELGAFLMTVTEATDLAVDGQTKEAYLALLAGLERDREAAEEGEAWGGELVTRYEEALARYDARWNVARE